MKTIEIISQDVFDKIRSRFTNLQMGDEMGEVTMDPRMARFYDFDFTLEGTNLGRVSISINELGTLKVFYGKSLLEDSDPISRDYWYDFLREMRMFAKRRLLRFDTRDITKSNLNKDDFQYLAANGPKDDNMNMSESAKFQGGKKTSYRQLEKTKLIAKHHKNIEDESFGARSRAGNIKALYVENEEGERFKYPFIHVAGAKAMQMHCAHGGRPYDDKGKAIINMSEQIAQLTAFKRHMGGHDGMNQEVNEIADRAHMKLESLRNQVNSLSKQQGYRTWSESFEPIATMQGTVEEMDEATMEDYKHKFTVSSFKEDLAQFFPLIHSIMQEAGTVDLEDYVHEGSDKEDDGYCDACDQPADKCKCDDVKENYFTKFTEWADALEEGRVEPDTLAALQELMAGDLQLGVDGTVAIETLQGIGIHDDALESALSELAKVSPEADPKATIGAWLAKEDPEAAAEFGLAPAVNTPAPVPQQQGTVDEPIPEVPVTEHPYEAVEKEMASGDVEKPTMRELAEWVAGHYNQAYEEEGFNSGFRKGPTELGTMAKKQFGEEYGDIVERMVSDLDDTALQRIARKGDKRRHDTNESDPESIHQDSPLTKVANPEPEEMETENTDFARILKLAGLKK